MKTPGVLGFLGWDGRADGRLLFGLFAAWKNHRDSIVFSLLDDIVKNYTTTTETKTAIDVARSVVSDVRVLDEAMIKPLEEYIGNTRIADLDKMELLRGYLAAIRR